MYGIMGCMVLGVASLYLPTIKEANYSTKKEAEASFSIGACPIFGKPAPQKFSRKIVRRA